MFTKTHYDIVIQILNDNNRYKIDINHRSVEFYRYLSHIYAPPTGHPPRRSSSTSSFGAGPARAPFWKQKPLRSFEIWDIQITTRYPPDIHHIRPDMTRYNQDQPCFWPWKLKHIAMSMFHQLQTWICTPWQISLIAWHELLVDWCLLPMVLPTTMERI